MFTNKEAFVTQRPVVQVYTDILGEENRESVTQNTRKYASLHKEYNDLSETVAKLNELDLRELRLYERVEEEISGIDDQASDYLIEEQSRVSKCLSHHPPTRQIVCEYLNFNNRQCRPRTVTLNFEIGHFYYVSNKCKQRGVVRYPTTENCGHRYIFMRIVRSVFIFNEFLPCDSIIAFFYDPSFEIVAHVKSSENRKHHLHSKLQEYFTDCSNEMNNSGIYNWSPIKTFADKDEYACQTDNVIKSVEFRCYGSYFMRNILKWRSLYDSNDGVFTKHAKDINQARVQKLLVLFELKHTVHMRLKRKRKLDENG